MQTTELSALLEFRSVSKFYSTGGGGLTRRVLHAVDDVSVVVPSKASVGIVGETGSGKSTLARIAVGLIRPTRGSVLLNKVDISRVSGRAMRRLRRKVQIVLQDPYDSLNPRRTVYDQIALPLQVFDIPGDRREAVAAALQAVGLDPGSHMNRLPHEFSGGQRQRIAIARALITKPELVVADEPVASLDVSVKAQIIDLMIRLKEEFALTYLVVSHDLTLIKNLTSWIVVMYLGKVVEEGPTGLIFTTPTHPYTRALLAAVPRITPPAHPPVSRIVGEPGMPIDPAPACRLAPRCPFAQEICREKEPPLRLTSSQHWAACHFAEEVVATPL